MSEQLTGRALDRAICELLGWSVYSYTYVSVNYYMAVAPHDGEYSIDDYKWLIDLGGQYAKRKTEEEAWADCTEYHADANATLSALGKDHHVEFMEIDSDTDDYLVCLAWLSDRETMGYSMHYGRSVNNYQEALARALLAALQAVRS